MSLLQESAPAVAGSCFPAEPPSSTGTSAPVFSFLFYTVYNLLVFQRLLVSFDGRRKMPSRSRRRSLLTISAMSPSSSGYSVLPSLFPSSSPPAFALCLPVSNCSAFDFRLSKLSISRLLYTRSRSLRRCLRFQSRTLT